MKKRESAKALVKAAKQTIGDFKFTAKKTTAGYVGHDIMSTLANIQEDDILADYLRAMVSAGLFKDVKIDKDVAETFFPHEPEIEEAMQNAYDEGGTPLPGSVSVPDVP